MLDIAYLQNNGFMDPLFPYPMAYCTMFNLAIVFLGILSALLILYLLGMLFRFFNSVI